MIDIFADVKPQPKLYIADVTVVFKFRPRKNSKKVETHTVRLYKYPIVLLDGDFPTNTSRNKFLQRVFRTYGRGKLDTSNIKVEKIENCIFSSNLAYKFNYEIH